MTIVAVDHRLGGMPRYYLAQFGRRLMLIPDELRKCACFVCARTEKGFSLQGTAFFVSVLLERITDGAVVYLVTAKHIIKSIEERFSDKDVYLRLNTQSDEAKYIKLPSDSTIWEYHEDPYVDVAVLPIAPGDPFVFKAVSEQMFLSKKIFHSYGVGLGDEVFIIGLFHKHYGTKRNIPIVRVGNIASMPEERVRTRNFGDHVDIDAYLVEARSISGLSGSPVFVNLGQMRMIDGQEHYSQNPVWFLLGLVHGHWDEDVATEDSTDAAGSKRNLINTGISIITPASKISEVLMLPKLREERHELEVRTLDRNAPTLDKADVIIRDHVGNPHHKEDFNNLLQSAVKGSSADE